MNNKSIFTKIIVLAVLLLAFSPTIMIGYSYFDTLNQDRPNSIMIGEWWGTPIYTAQEFYYLATGDNTTADDVYYLANDIDFTGFSWVLNSYNFDATFRGTLDGNGKTISNLTITTSSYSNRYLGIFPRMEGGSVYNLTLSNIDLTIGYSTSVASGLIAGNVFGLDNKIENITIENVGVRGNSTYGTGGLIGNIENYSTTVEITNIKATGLKVFSTSSYVGGLVGSLRSSSVVLDVLDVDIQGEVSSMTTSSYTGGILGYITNGAYFHLNRGIVDMTSQNTLETGSYYYLRYSNRYLGGFIGYNQSTSDKVVMENSFFTGGLVSSDTRRAYYIGTAIGRSSGSESMSNLYYSKVLFKETNGTLTYDPSYTPRGVMTTLVNTSTMPSVYWWNSFATLFVTTDDIWLQDSISGQLYLSR